jgi:phthiocerol/phenolphthiocerol synthesis type-I polyketide synthase E
VSGTEIAIVGVGCRFPDAWTPEEFWANIDKGTVSMRPLPEDVLRASGVDRQTLAADDYVRVGTQLPGVADFAADFFGYTPREAETIDPQQRIFLESCWEALERAGHAAGDGTVGVFAASGAGNYSASLFAAKVRDEGLGAAVGDLDLTLGGQSDFMPSRTAYKLGLTGPAVSVQTGCSSSLYALHYASLSLLAGECDIALAGGAVVQEPMLGYRHKPGRALSSDGQCRSFDHRSSGTNHGSGVGVVALRLLADALDDGDPVLAVLHGSAVGNDGADKLGYVAPSPAGIARVVARALRVSGISGDRLRYLEAHGTATPLGDQVELEALTTALGASGERTGYCRLGSVMSNIGHTGAAAGIAGFIKAVHIAATGVLPPHPSFEQPREPGVLAESPFTISADVGYCSDDCYVLVNSVGMGGADAAAIIGPPPNRVREPAPDGGKVRLMLSARNRGELDTLSARLADALERDELSAADVAHTLRVGRRHFEERRLVTAEPERLASALRTPRPPWVETLRSKPRQAAVILPDDPETCAVLRAALPPDTEVVTDSAASQRDVFVVRVESDVEAALASAWLHGVPVDWASSRDGSGRRVVLPVYPFTRHRYWALDRLSLATPGAVPSARAETSSGDAEAILLDIWRSLFGTDEIGLDDSFGSLAGTSLLGVQLTLEIQNRFGCLINVHRAGGGQVTVRRLAELVRAQGQPSGSPAVGLDAAAVGLDDGMDQGDDQLIDKDLELPLGEVSPVRSRGKDFLLTGATGFLGAFLLRELLDHTSTQIYCLVRADDEDAAMQRLRAAAAKYALPDPDAERVRAVPGDLRDIAKIGNDYHGGELGHRIGHILHCAAKVVFTEPYRTLREDNVLPMADLLAWARGHGIRDFSYVSSMAAAAPAMGSGDRYLETRMQALNPRVGSYGISKWVSERLLARAEQDGMRVRVFRPGLIMGSSQTGASNERDLICFALVSGLAVGGYPEDDRMLVMAPADIVAKGAVQLALSQGSIGRAYHLVADRGMSLRQLFALLATAGLPTEPMPLRDWQERVRKAALETGNPLLSAAALLEIEGHDTNELAVQATGWQPWLNRNGLEPRLTGDSLRRSLEFLAEASELVAALVGDLLHKTEKEITQ